MCFHSSTTSSPEAPPAQQIGSALAHCGSVAEVAGTGWNWLELAGTDLASQNWLELDGTT